MFEITADRPAYKQQSEKSSGLWGFGRPLSRRKNLSGPTHKLVWSKGRKVFPQVPTFRDVKTNF